MDQQERILEPTNRNPTLLACRLTALSFNPQEYNPQRQALEYFWSSITNRYAETERFLTHSMITLRDKYGKEAEREKPEIFPELLRVRFPGFFPCGGRYHIRGKNYHLM